MKAGVPGVIKRRLFITPILGLPGRGRPQPNDRLFGQAVNCQLSTVNCQLKSDLSHPHFENLKLYEIGCVAG
ncbi:MAG: hypothetical protein JGK01_24185 [Microcoleus sp. PH2017_03_ELD_O_A]|uniref:hypothetical protein n=1 Tax=unclassified Microcoleus TaxID=2642155 RepID=UPI001DA50E12|nr:MULTISPECIES: hypothetical protein [unclassified Microcoleus]MCC3432264.1 hypothetical protein [Microcoleus sp. PH2017_04_SCI_O_A]MCC3444733.1 hypothetical protein [Microcoleus sp. PH2017_03_ELD_O_A]MCC3512396.1 hypothetical protein [Microcoleus sp. PH2017_17_BER_D_A]MCC3565730.1 hypothetical protein [Microcoleus sp. PH2017_31_RDM_U_A]